MMPTFEQQSTSLSFITHHSTPQPAVRAKDRSAPLLSPAGSWDSGVQDAPVTKAREMVQLSQLPQCLIKIN